MHHAQTGPPRGRPFPRMARSSDALSLVAPLLSQRPPVPAATRPRFSYRSESPVAHVSPQTTHHHLALLRRFCALYGAVEAPFPDLPSRALAVQRFFVSAEARYLQYLDLLDSFLHTSSLFSADDAVASMPLPPWDVAVVFHAHCLSPFRFYADIKHRATRQHAVDLWDLIAFPLARLHHLIASDEWTDGASERLWFDMFRTPYQVWRSNPLKSRSPLELPHVRFPCPLCQIPCEFDPAVFTQFRITKQGALTFPCCGNSFTVDSIAAIQLRQDMQKLSDNESPWPVKGLVFEPVQGQLVSAASANISVVLSSNAFANFLSDPNPSWFQIDKRLEEVSRETSKKLVQARRNIFNDIRNSYLGMVWWELSIDLVGAALRQADFASKITAPGLNDLDTPSSLETACMRYHRFLRLFRSGAAEMRVPTIDIDLCWHTHQLFPAAYRNWCLQNLDRVINHDDTIAPGDLDEGLRCTSLAWFREYGEPYTTEDLRKDYLTGVKKVGGVLFPPYGFHVWNKARKLDQSRMDAGNTQVGSVDRNVAQHASPSQLYALANPPPPGTARSPRSDQSGGWAPAGPIGFWGMSGGGGNFGGSNCGGGGGFGGGNCGGGV